MKLMISSSILGGRWVVLRHCSWACQGTACVWLARTVLPAQPFIPATNHQLCWSFITKKRLLETFCFPLLNGGLRFSHLTWLSPALASLWEVGVIVLVPWHIPGGVSISFQHPHTWNQSFFVSCSLVASTALQSLGKDAFLGSDLYRTDSLTECHTLSMEHIVRRHGQSDLPHVWGHATTPHPSCTKLVFLAKTGLPGRYPSWL